MKPEIIHIFHDVDLRCGHNGLTDYASKHRVSVKNLTKGEFVVFLNRAKDRVKLMGSDQVMVYVIGDEITNADLEAIPTWFNGDKFILPKKLKLAKAA